MSAPGVQVTVGTSPTLLLDGSAGSLTDPIPGLITNQDPTVSVFVGDENVDTSGYELKAGASIGVSLVADSLYAVVASGTLRVDVLKGRQ